MPEFHGITSPTIVAESVIQERLIAMFEECGARGWTASMAEGPDVEGLSGIDGGNVRIETLVPEDVAALIWATLEQEFFTHYAVSAWAYDVRVARLGRYT